MNSVGELNIRAAGVADCEAVAELHYLSHTTSFVDFADENWVESREYSEYHTFWCDYLADQPGKERTWLAELGGAVVGTVTIMALENSSPIFQPTSAGDSHDWEAACLRLMYVHPDHLRKGIGQALVGRAINFLETQDYEAVTLITHAANRRARAFYERMGWALDEVFNQQVDEFFEEPAGMRRRARYFRQMKP